MAGPTHYPESGCQYIPRKQALERTAPDLLPYPLGFSAGHALRSGSWETPDALMARADATLCRAKAAGRGRLVSDTTPFAPSR